MLICIGCIALTLISSGIFFFKLNSDKQQVKNEQKNASAAYQDDLRKVAAENESRRMKPIDKQTLMLKRLRRNNLKGLKKSIRVRKLTANCLNMIKLRKILIYH